MRLAGVVCNELTTLCRPHWAIVAAIRRAHGRVVETLTIGGGKRQWCLVFFSLFFLGGVQKSLLLLRRLATTDQSTEKKTHSMSSAGLASIRPTMSSAVERVAITNETRVRSPTARAVFGLCSQPPFSTGLVGRCHGWLGDIWLDPALDPASRPCQPHLSPQGLSPPRPSLSLSPPPPPSDLQNPIQTSRVQEMRLADEGLFACQGSVMEAVWPSRPGLQLAPQQYIAITGLAVRCAPPPLLL